MVEETNQLLGYTIDTLLKAFNPDRTPIMNRFHFFKLMNLLDHRLQNQGVNINLPGYWYKYGFYSEYRFFDSVLTYPFSKYYVTGDNVYPPIVRTGYEEKVSKKDTGIILTTIRYLYEKYGGKEGYGDSAKEESYFLYSPYKFNTIFQSYLFITDVKTSRVSESLKNEITTKLDELLPDFPVNSFPELASIYFEWDDTTRLVLDCAPENKRLELIIDLREEFWEIYSKRVRIKHNQHIPESVIREWKSKFNTELDQASETIEDIRGKILSDFYTPSEEKKEIAKKLMTDIYNIPSEGA